MERLTVQDASSGTGIRQVGRTRRVKRTGPTDLHVPAAQVLRYHTRGCVQRIGSRIVDVLLNRRNHGIGNVVCRIRWQDGDGNTAGPEIVVKLEGYGIAHSVAYIESLAVGNGPLLCQAAGRRIHAVQHARTQIDEDISGVTAGIHCRRQAFNSTVRNGLLDGVLDRRRHDIGRIERIEGNDTSIGIGRHARAIELENDRLRSVTERKRLCVRDAPTSRLQHLDRQAGGQLEPNPGAGDGHRQRRLAGVVQRAVQEINGMAGGATDVERPVTQRGQRHGHPGSVHCGLNCVGHGHRVVGIIKRHRHIPGRRNAVAVELEDPRHDFDAVGDLEGLPVADFAGVDRTNQVRG